MASLITGPHATAVPRLHLRPLPQLLQRRLGGANKLRAALRVLLGGWAAMGLTYGEIYNKTDCPSCARACGGVDW